MSGLFRSTSQSSYKPNYSGVQINTSTNTLPVPLCYGTVQISANLLWYNNFTQTAVKAPGAKGGLFGAKNSGEYDYSASVIMGLCEGPISSVGNVWDNQALTNLSAIGLGLMNGAQGQAPWSYVTSFYPSEAIPYNATAYVYSTDFSLGSSATIDQVNFEVYALLAGTGFNQIDADPALVIADFLTNPLHGVGFPSASIDYNSLYGGFADSSYQSYCKAVGFAISPALSSTETADSVLERWLKITNTAPVWSGGLLRFIPYGDTPLLVGNQVTISEVRQTPSATEILTAFNAQTREITGVQMTFVTLRVSFWAQFVSDGGVVLTFDNAALTNVPYVANAAPASGTYMVNNGQYIFAFADTGEDVTITYTYAIPASYYPNVTPVVVLDDDDFISDGNGDPFTIARTDPYKAYNVERVEITQRDNAYSNLPIEARDQDAIELYGLRVDSGVTAHEICDQQMGGMAAQLLLQRGLYIRNNFKFKLSWEYSYLDPMDVISLSADTRLNGQLARIVSIDEDDKGMVDCVAEEFYVGVGTATPYLVAGASGQLLNSAAAAPAINPPVIIEPPLALSLTATPQIWAAISAPESSGGVGWGGANVWASIDNATYEQLGKVNAPATMGILTNSFALFSGVNPDLTSSADISTTMNGSQIPTATDLAASLLNTICAMDKELFSYATSTLTGTDQFALTYFYRGAYSTPTLGSGKGALFAYMAGPGVFKWTLPSTYSSQPFWLKFQSFNSLGGGLQDISTCIAFQYTPGVGIDHPVALMIMAGGPIGLGASVTVSPSITDDWGGVTGAVAYRLDLGVGA